MTQVARGSFTVEMKPQSEPDVVDGVNLGRVSLDKRFEGDLAATGRGEMLTVPDSGTGALTGLSGTFRLNMVDGKHLYEFEYELPATP